MVFPCFQHACGMWILFKSFHSPAGTQNLRRSKTKASFFRAFESGPRQGWEVARAVVSCENIFSLSCSYPLKTIVSAASCLTGLQVSLRLAPKNYPSEGIFLEASRVNVGLVVVQISWQENPTRTPGTFTSNLPFQANPGVCHHTLNHSHNANDAQSTAPPGRKAQTQRRGTLVPNVFRLFIGLTFFPCLWSSSMVRDGTPSLDGYTRLCHTPSENKIHEKQVFGGGYLETQADPCKKDYYKNRRDPITS